MTRRLAAVVLVSGFVAVVWEGSAAAEVAGTRLAELEAELEALVAEGAVDVAADEVRRARELVARARAAEAGGERRGGEAVLAVLPLQLRLIRELLAAAGLEERAAEAERSSLDAERRAREARVALERLLERLVALSVGDPFE